MCCVCNDAFGLFGALCRVHNTEEWRRFVDLWKVSLKTVRLHNDNIYPSVQLAHSIHMKGSHESTRTFFIVAPCILKIR